MRSGYAWPPSYPLSASGEVVERVVGQSIGADPRRVPASRVHTPLGGGGVATHALLASGEIAGGLVRAPRRPAPYPPRSGSAQCRLSATRRYTRRPTCRTPGKPMKGATRKVAGNSSSAARTPS